MTKRKLILHNKIPNQDGLFDNEISEGALALNFAFRDVLSKALSKCRESRWQVAAKISELTKHNINKDLIDKYTSSNLSYALRAEDLPAFCFVTNNLQPFEVLLRPLGCEIVDPHESKQMKLARLQQKEAKLKAEIAALRDELGLSKR